MRKSNYAFFLVWMLGALACALFGQGDWPVTHMIFISALAIGFLLCMIDEPVGVFALLCILPVVLFTLVFGTFFGAPYPNPFALALVIGMIGVMANRRRQLGSARIF